ncbi:GAF domain-containing protein [Mycolicibacterium sp.]|uniref:GAF domain-containing protein n=1 Tax=Mycolicibacterium sp. TaxID=2320850 RepID=UPI003D0CED17
MTDDAPRTDSTPGLAGLTSDFDALVDRLGVKSVLVMRSEPDTMVVAATAGDAAKHYTVGAAGKKALDDSERVPLYCEHVVDSDSALFVEDSREHPKFAGNEDEVEFGLHNYLGLAVHGPDGAVVGTVCVLDDHARDYAEGDVAALEALRDKVEGVLREDGSALGD